MAKPKKLDEEAVQAIARALSDPSRYAILKQLARCDAETPCSAVRGCMEITPATLSHHMKELRLAGLVREMREGRSVNYVLQHEVLDQYMEHLRSDFL